MAAFSDDRQNFRFPLFDDDVPIKRNSSQNSNENRGSRNQQYDKDSRDFDVVKRTDTNRGQTSSAKRNRQRFDNSMYKDEPTSSFLASDTTPKRSLFGSDEREQPIKRKRSFDQVRLDKYEAPINTQSDYDDYSYDDNIGTPDLIENEVQDELYDDEVVETTLGEDTSSQNRVTDATEIETSSKIVGSRSFKPTVLPQSFIQKKSISAAIVSRLESALTKSKDSYILFEPSNSDNKSALESISSEENDESLLTYRKSRLEEELKDEQIYDLEDLEDLTSEERREILRTINDVQTSYTSFED